MHSVIAPHTGLGQFVFVSDESVSVVQDKQDDSYPAGNIVKAPIW